MKTKKLPRAILAILGAGLFSCGLLAQQAQANTIQGSISFAGAVQFDTNSLATATRVNTWFDIFGHPSFSSVAPGATDDFSGIPAGTLATMAEPWIFNPSTPHPGLWSVG